MLHEPSLIKSCTDIDQFVTQPLYPNYRNHTQAEKRAVKLTTTIGVARGGAQGARAPPIKMLPMINCHKKTIVSSGSVFF